MFKHVLNNYDLHCYRLLDDTLVISLGVKNAGDFFVIYRYNICWVAYKRVTFPILQGIGIPILSLTKCQSEPVDARIAVSSTLTRKYAYCLICRCNAD